MFLMLITFLLAIQSYLCPVYIMGLTSCAVKMYDDIRIYVINQQKEMKPNVRNVNSYDCILHPPFKCARLLNVQHTRVPISEEESSSSSKSVCVIEATHFNGSTVPAMTASLRMSLLLLTGLVSLLWPIPSLASIHNRPTNCSGMDPNSVQFHTSLELSPSMRVSPPMFWTGA